MIPVWFTLLALAVFLLMEGVAWWSHRYIMHGAIGWGWHRSHHEPHGHGLEKNDLYAVVGSVVGFGLFLLALLTKSWVLYAVATGVTAYGAMYAFVHDGLVHQRWPFHWMPRNGYGRRLVQAHKLHHAVQTRDGAVSFGFVFAPDPHRLKAMLKAARGAQAAVDPAGLGPASPPPGATAPSAPESAAR